MEIVVIYFAGLIVWFLACGAFHKEMESLGVDVVMSLFGIIWPFATVLGVLASLGYGLFYLGTKIRSSFEKQ